MKQAERYVKLSVEKSVKLVVKYKKEEYYSKEFGIWPFDGGKRRVEVCKKK